MPQTHAVCGELVHRGSEPFIFIFLEPDVQWHSWHCCLPILPTIVKCMCKQLKQGHTYLSHACSDLNMGVLIFRMGRRGVAGSCLRCSD